MVIGVCGGISGWAEQPSLAGPMGSAREQPYSVLLRCAPNLRAPPDVLAVDADVHLGSAVEDVEPRPAVDGVFALVAVFAVAAQDAVVPSEPVDRIVAVPPLMRSLPVVPIRTSGPSVPWTTLGADNSDPAPGRGGSRRRWRGRRRSPAPSRRGEEPACEDRQRRAGEEKSQRA